MCQTTVHIFVPTTASIDRDTKEKLSECGENEGSFQSSKCDVANLAYARRLGCVTRGLVERVVRKLRTARGTRTKEGPLRGGNFRVVVVVPNVIRPLHRFIIVTAREAMSVDGLHVTIPPNVNRVAGHRSLKILLKLLRLLRHQISVFATKANMLLLPTHNSSPEGTNGELIPASDCLDISEESTGARDEINARYDQGQEYDEVTLRRMFLILIPII